MSFLEFLRAFKWLGDSVILDVVDCAAAKALRTHKNQQASSRCCNHVHSNALGRRMTAVAVWTGWLGRSFRHSPSNDGSHLNSRILAHILDANALAAHHVTQRGNNEAVPGSALRARAADPQSRLRIRGKRSLFLNKWVVGKLRGTSRLVPRFPG